MVDTIFMVRLNRFTYKKREHAIITLVEELRRPADGDTAVHAMKHEPLYFDVCK